MSERARARAVAIPFGPGRSRGAVEGQLVAESKRNVLQGTLQCLSVYDSGCRDE